MLSSDSAASRSDEGVSEVGLFSNDQGLNVAVHVCARRFIFSYALCSDWHVEYIESAKKMRKKSV